MKWSLATVSLVCEFLFASAEFTCPDHHFLAGVIATCDTIYGTSPELDIHVIRVHSPNLVNYELEFDSTDTSLPQQLIISIAPYHLILQFISKSNLLGI
jgi:hypothetical protein